MPLFAYSMETKFNHEQLVKLLRDKDNNIQVLDQYCQEHAPRVCQKLGEPVYNKVLAAWTEEEKRELLWCLQNTRMTTGRNGAPPVEFGDKLGFYNFVVTFIDEQKDVGIEIIDFVAITKLHHYSALRPRHKFLIDRKAEPGDCKDK